MVRARLHPVLAVEFQSSGEARFALRMLDYPLRLYRRNIIQSTWEDSEMPVPSFANLRYETGRSEGREEGREAMIAAMLRHRFGPDSRIPSVAGSLAALEPEDYLDRFEKAASLDDLTISA